MHRKSDEDQIKNQELIYNNQTCNLFVKECEDAGYEVEHYHGRFCWEGPAVRVESTTEYHDLIRATTMDLQSDNLGLDMIVYPVITGKLIGENQ